MKISKRIIIILMLCIQVAFVHPAKWTSKEITEANYKILKKALNATISGNDNFYASKSKHELETIIALSNQALANKKIVELYRDELKKSVPALEKTLNTLIIKTAEALKRTKSEKVKAKPKQTKPEVKAQPKTPVAQVPSKPKREPLVPTETIKIKSKKVPSHLKSALNSTINDVPNFYKSKSVNALTHIIEISNEALADPETLQACSDEFKKTIPELKDLFAKLIAGTTQELKLKTQEKKDIQSQLDNALATQASKYSLYVMLDVPDLNSNGQPINWQDVLNKTTSQIPTSFVPNQYHHITLAWYESKQPFTQKFLIKIENALARANEILKIIYPDGAPGISLVDGVSILGTRAAVFRVAQSKDLKNIQEIILKFLSFEGITDFKFSTFEIGSPLHMTLGNIDPKNKPANLDNILQSLNAPAGIRKSQGESFIAKMFRATYSGGKGYQKIGEYAF